MLVKKIISGGQTGADQGGLEAGRCLSIETGGTAPYNWMTEYGRKEKMLRSYGLIAGPPDPKTYPKRTRLNVYESDGTVIFGFTDSPGSRLTKELCTTYDKPCIINPTFDALRKWVKENNIQVLNVAGNRESKNPGIFNRVVNILTKALQEEL